MGSGVSKKLDTSREVIVIGLDNSGKSTILKKLNNPEDKCPVVPTISFRATKIKVNSTNITCFDMSGQGRYRFLWQQYYGNCHGLVFVLDSADRLRMPVAREELELAVKSDELSQKNVPILILANKNDLPDAIAANKCATLLDLDHLLKCPWLACSSNGLSGEGINEGFNWLTNQMRTSRTKS